MSLPAMRSASLACVLPLLWALSPLMAHAHPQSRAARADVSEDFAALAQQRSRACPEQPAPEKADAAWHQSVQVCAWQNRLRMRQWEGPVANGAGACVSAEALWWTRARWKGGAGTGAALAWRHGWTSQVIEGAPGPEQRLVIMRRADDGRWQATEWRWLPSEQAATRRWQQGRWQLLLARASQLRGAPHTEAIESERWWPALQANLGKRAGEASGDTLRWQSDGRCLQVDSKAPGAQQLRLSFAIDDSRLEQRAALQLQLARRYPKATWLTSFSLVPVPPNARGGAQFYATWIDAGEMLSQLWIPTRGDGPVLRLRIQSRPTPGAPSDPARAAEKLVLERELLAIAALWRQGDD